MIRRICLFLSILALLGACTESAENPADSPVETRPSNGVVYGKDSTTFTRDILRSNRNSRMRSNILASGAIVPRERIVKGPNLAHAFLDQTVAERYGVCPEERLAEDLSASLCSGVLISKREFLTVGHCFETFDCSDVVIAFDYRSTSIDQVNFYSCTNVRPLDPKAAKSDLVVVTLDRDVVGRTPVEYRKKSIVTAEPVYSVGHPLGTPQKWSSGAIRGFRAKEGRIQTSLDVFTGSSGAPVFSGITHRLLGLLTDGEDDFLEGKSCLKYKVCAEGECVGESVTPIP